MFYERRLFAWNKLEPYVDVHFAEAKTESRCSTIIIVFFTLRHEKRVKERLVGSCNQTIKFKKYYGSSPKCIMFDKNLRTI